MHMTTCQVGKFPDSPHLAQRLQLRVGLNVQDSVRQVLQRWRCRCDALAACMHRVGSPDTCWACIALQQRLAHCIQAATRNLGP